MSDTWDALKNADANRRMQVRQAMKLEALCLELESLPNLKHLETSAEEGRKSAKHIRKQALALIDKPLAPGNVLEDLIDEAMTELAMLGPPTPEEADEWRKEFENETEGGSA